MELYRRENYLKKIRGFYHDSEMIKVITGVRRCGKSSLMQTIVEELKEQGVPEANLVFLDLDSKKHKSIGTRNRQAMQRRRNEVFIHRRNTEYYRL